jgi:hypothetical protein
MHGAEVIFLQGPCRHYDVDVDVWIRPPTLIHVLHLPTDSYHSSCLHTMRNISQLVAWKKDAAIRTEACDSLESRIIRLLQQQRQQQQQAYAK